VYKINRLHIYLILLACLLLHLTVLDYAKLFGARPDLMLIAVVFFSLFLGWKRGLESGVAAGLMQDILAFNLFWVNTFVLGTTGFLVGILNAKLFKESKATQVSLVFFFTIFSMALRFLLTALFAKSVKITFSEYFITSIFLTATYTALISMLIFSAFINFYDLREESETFL